MKRNAGIDMLAPKLPLRVAYWAASTEGPAITLSLECGEFLLRGGRKFYWDHIKLMSV